MTTPSSAFSGELTWESATELANRIDTLTMRYFYKRIELVIHSPGGLAAALEHLARAIAGWRERGVHLRTRVVASAASAAAVLLSMGDERIAEPEARLLYHLSRVLDPGAVPRTRVPGHRALARATSLDPPAQPPPCRHRLSRENGRSSPTPPAPRSLRSKREMAGREA